MGMKSPRKSPSLLSAAPVFHTCPGTNSAAFELNLNSFFSLWLRTESLHRELIGNSEGDGANPDSGGFAAAALRTTPSTLEFCAPRTCCSRSPAPRTGALRLEVGHAPSRGVIPMAPSANGTARDPVARGWVRGVP